MSTNQNQKPEFRMTKYFQDYLKSEFRKVLFEGNREKPITYFAWLKQIRTNGQLPEFYARYQDSKKPAKPTKPNSNRATHEGTCQCCLRIQMLPNNLLAKHGYQVAFRGSGGFFSGTCKGSAELPFELSCEAMKRFVLEAEERVIELHETIKQVTENAVKFPTQGWYYERLKSNGQTIYRWVFIQYEDHVIANTGKKHAWEAPYTMATVQANKGNTQYISYLGREVEHLGKFIAEREAMIAKWIPAPLIDRREG